MVVFDLLCAERIDRVTTQAGRIPQGLLHERHQASRFAVGDS
ncbi:MAG: hypothetical protein AB2705_16865 [Candidatus Thiodiazotropha sp.]